MFYSFSGSFEVIALQQQFIYKIVINFGVLEYKYWDTFKCNYFIKLIKELFLLRKNNKIENKSYLCYTC